MTYKEVSLGIMLVFSLIACSKTSTDSGKTPSAADAPSPQQNVVETKTIQPAEPSVVDWKTINAKSELLRKGLAALKSRDDAYLDSDEASEYIAPDWIWSMEEDRPVKEGEAFTELGQIIRQHPDLALEFALAYKRIAEKKKPVDLNYAERWRQLALTSGSKKAAEIRIIPAAPVSANVAKTQQSPAWAWTPITTNVPPLEGIWDCIVKTNENTFDVSVGFEPYESKPMGVFTHNVSGSGRAFQGLYSLDGNTAKIDVRRMGSDGNLGETSPRKDEITFISQAPGMLQFEYLFSGDEKSKSRNYTCTLRPKPKPTAKQELSPAELEACEYGKASCYEKNGAMVQACLNALRMVRGCP